MTSNLPPIPSHDHPAFDRVFGEHLEAIYPRLVRLVYARLDAENFSQDVACRVWEKRGLYDPQKPFAPWVFTIALRLRVDQFGRGRGRHQPQQLDEEAVHVVEQHPETDPLHRCLVNSEKEALFAAMNRLSEDERTAITLRYFEELSYAEISQIMERTASAVGGLILRAKEKLFKELKQRCGIVSAGV